MQHELPQSGRQKGERREQKSQEHQQGKNGDFNNITQHAPPPAVARQEVHHVFRILVRAIVLAIVMVAVVTREERRGRERQDAHHQIPRDLERPHLAMAKMAYLVHERAQAVKPEDGDRVGRELPQRPQGGHQEDTRRPVRRHQAQDEIAPIFPCVYLKKVRAGVLQRAPRHVNPFLFVRHPCPLENRVLNYSGNDRRINNGSSGFRCERSV